MGRRSYGANDSKRSIFFQRNPVIAAAAIGMQPFHAGDELDNLQLLDLVVEPANLRLGQFSTAPFGGIGVAHRLDDFDNFDTRGDALLLELQVSAMCRLAGFVGVLENSEFAATGAAAAGSFVAATARGRGDRRGGWLGRRIGAKAAQDFADDISNESFVNLGIHVLAL